MKTEILDGDEGVEKAAALLGAGALVALPTETVYGLAGDALDPAAAAQIFEVKERPAFDPLIVHLPSLEWLDRRRDRRWPVRPSAIHRYAAQRQFPVGKD